MSWQYCFPDAGNARLGKRSSDCAGLCCIKQLKNYKHPYRNQYVYVGAGPRELYMGYMFCLLMVKRFRI